MCRNCRRQQHWKYRDLDDQFWLWPIDRQNCYETPFIRLISSSHRERLSTSETFITGDNCPFYIVNTSEKCIRVNMKHVVIYFKTQLIYRSKHIRHVSVSHNEHTTCYNYNQRTCVIFSRLYNLLSVVWGYCQLLWNFHCFFMQRYLHTLQVRDCSNQGWMIPLNYQIYANHSVQ